MPLLTVTRQVNTAINREKVVDFAFRAVLCCKFFGRNIHKLRLLAYLNVLLAFHRLYILQDFFVRYLKMLNNNHGLKDILL